MPTIDWPDGEPIRIMPAMHLPSGSRWLIAVLGALTALPSLSVDIGLPAMPALAAAFGVGAGDVQATLSAFLVGFALGQLVHGAVSDRVGRRPVLIAGMAVFVAAGGVCAATHSLPLMIAMRGVQGVGACAGVVVARAMIRDAFVTGARHQSILSLASNLGTLVGPLLGGAIVTALGVRAVYAVLPATGLVLLVVCARCVPETWRASVAPSAGYRRVITDGRAMGPALLNGLVFGALFACIAATPPLLIGRFGVSPAGLGAFFALIAVVSLAGSWLNHAVLVRASDAALAVLGLALIALATAGLAIAAVISPSLVPVAAAMLLLVFACGIVMPNAIAAAMAPLPQLAGSVAAIVGCSQAAFGAIAAALVGIAPGSVAGLTAVVAGFAVLGISCGAVVLRDRGRRPGVR